LAVDVRAAIDRFMRDRGVIKCESAYRPIAAPALPKASAKKAAKKALCSDSVATTIPVTVKA